MNPRDAAQAGEHGFHVGKHSHVEHMAGYGLTGLAFESGHVIAFRCVTASSIGPPYRSIWHRYPDGRWVIHTNVEPARACPRYFGPSLDAWHVDEIDVMWTGPAHVTVAAAGARLHLTIRLRASAMTRLLGASARAAPGVLLQTRTAGSAAGRLLETGPLSLAGVAPAGHAFHIRPRAFWRVAAAAAVVGGKDAGPLHAPARQPALGEFRIPRRGLFATGSVTFTAPRAAARLFP